MPEGAISPIFVGKLQLSANATRITMSPRFGSLNERRCAKLTVVERRGAYAKQTPKNIISPGFGRLNETRRAEPVAIERRRTHTKHTRRHTITTVQQPERKETRGSGGYRSQIAYEHTKRKLISPRSATFA